MNIVIVGRGVIGLTYGCLLSEAGHSVHHLLRESSHAPGSPVSIDILDGRTSPPSQRMHHYSITPVTGDTTNADLVIVSVPGAALPGAIASLRARGLDNHLLIMSGVWQSRAELDALVCHTDYVLGYPIAGGRRDDSSVESVLFDSVRLEAPRPHTADLHAAAMAAFAASGLKVEQSARMLEWLWVHQAVNAGIISAIASRREGDAEISGVVRDALADPTTLARGIRNIRECLRVVQARGVRLRHNLADIAPFVAVPAGVAARLMVAMFRRDVLSRRIMELHHNLDDISALMAEVHTSAIELGVATPGFTRDFALARRSLVS